MLIVRRLEKQSSIVYATDVQLHLEVSIVENIGGCGMRGNSDNFKVLMTIVEYYQNLLREGGRGERARERDGINNESERKYIVASSSMYIYMLIKTYVHVGECAHAYIPAIVTCPVGRPGGQSWHTYIVVCVCLDTGKVVQLVKLTLFPSLIYKLTLCE